MGLEPKGQGDPQGEPPAPMSPPGKENKEGE